MLPVTPVHLLRGLPDETDEALFELGRRIRRAAEHRWTSFSRPDHAALVMVLEQFIVQNQIPLQFSKRQENESWADQLSSLLKQVDLYKEELRLTRAEQDIADLVERRGQSGDAGLPFGHALLNREDKTWLRKKLNQVRVLVDASSLPGRQRNALYSRISNLFNELEKDLTRSDPFVAFSVDLALCVENMRDLGPPAMNQFKDVLRTIMRRRVEQEAEQAFGHGTVAPFPKAAEA